MTVRNKCRTLNYPADGVGIKGTLKPQKSYEHFTVFFPFFSSALFYLQYQIFIPMVNKVMLKHRINHQRYDMLICRIVKVRKFHFCVCFFFSVKKSFRPFACEFTQLCFFLKKMHIYASSSNLLPPESHYYTHCLSTLWGKFPEAWFSGVWSNVCLIGLHPGRGRGGLSNLPASPSPQQPRRRPGQRTGGGGANEEAACQHDGSSKGSIAVNSAACPKHCSVFVMAPSTTSEEVKMGTWTNRQGKEKQKCRCFLSEALLHQRAMCKTFPFSFRTFNGLL